MDKKKPWMLQLVAEVHGCDAEVYLNDIPVTRLVEFQKQGSALPIHEWIVQGANELKLVINPGPVPAQAHHAGTGAAIKPDAWAKARLVPVLLGSPPSDDDKAFIELRFVNDASVAPTGPVVRQASGKLPLAFGRRLWEKGERIDSLTPALEASALAFINEVRDVLQRGDARRLAPLMRDKMTDFSVSYGLDANTELVKYVEEWQRDARVPGWLLAPVTAELASLRLCGSGRCVECIAKDWEPLIRMSDLSAGGILLRLGIARVRDTWQVAF